ncbi:2-amino-4-hydroxy-6-hydroxymethyldihydropteridine diphosphokinase [Ruegeria sp. 2012CJ41-6]|uniref:2-amino-4-hydroxy-6-hydroxymethyldihydropteridine pyrophosphokinase n=1 Tax=Ruegeria spongiae TaxID=2942209 RepID=A0ABT0Q3X9_9RHOB|nr:2-amino-4-hydroxy-6-hydroxymethyldihydropteridine diphosphokinase [Ruegeria spongiae]MCL6284575.1 2-amino-4-hydroxy-6-hydroxymethyldihydropteridine diphosphokinase [Ruegeria spongiae]
MTENRSISAVALGANLKFHKNPPQLTLGNAIEALASGGVVIRAVSRFFATPCFPAGAGPDYVNAAILVEAADTPQALLRRLHVVEAQFGRERVQRWGMRTLDLDLVLAGDRVEPDLGVFRSWNALEPQEQARNAPDRLILPHPRLQDRAFVLVPLADIAPDWRHPVLGQKVSEMLAALPDQERAAVVPI